MSTPTAALPVTEQPVTEQPATTPRTMQAIVFDDFGGPEVLVAREIPVPEVRPHDLLVRNASIGVNRADLLHRKGACGRAYFGDADTMGLEIAGTVVAMGPEVQGFAVGDRVMGSWAAVPTRSCRASTTAWPCRCLRAWTWWPLAPWPRCS